MPHPSPYATVDDVEGWTESGVSMVGQHSPKIEEWEWLLSSSSICIDKYCHRVFYKSSEEARDYDVPWSPRYDIYVGDIATLSSVAMLAHDGDTEAITPAPILVRPELPYEPSQKIRFQEKMDRSTCPRLRVTGEFGWGEVPDDIQLACLLLTRRALSRPSSPSGAGGIGGFLVKMDPDVADILKKYKVRKTL